MSDTGIEMGSPDLALYTIKASFTIIPASSTSSSLEAGDQEFFEDDKCRYRYVNQSEVCLRKGKFWIITQN